MANQRTVPFEIKELDENQKKFLSAFYPSVDHYREVGPNKWLINDAYEKIAADFYNFKLYPEDVLIMGFPRSGNTLTQELVWLLQNDLDFAGAKGKFWFSRIGHLDPFTSSGGLKLPPSAKGRTLKTHLAFDVFSPDLLTWGAKVIYIARSPKDVVVSFYHFHRMMAMFNFQGNFGEFYNLFEKGPIATGPYWNHIEEGWKNRNSENVCFLFYEEFMKDFRGTIRKVADFLKKPLSKEQLDELENYLSFNNLQKNNKVNITEFLKDAGINLERDSDSMFLRKGKVGGWKEFFDDKLNERADKWIAENVDRIGIKYPEN